MSEKHKPYQKVLSRTEDFKVKYKFLLGSKNGRSKPPYQGTRLDFWYPHHNHTMKGIFMIWPEFEEENGSLIESGMVHEEGIARMWIVNDKFRAYHKERIHIGTKGFFLEGREVAECEVIEIKGLVEEIVR